MHQLWVTVQNREGKRQTIAINLLFRCCCCCCCTYCDCCKHPRRKIEEVWRGKCLRIGFAKCKVGRWKEILRKPKKKMNTGSSRKGWDSWHCSKQSAVERLPALLADMLGWKCCNRFATWEFNSKQIGSPWEEIVSGIGKLLFYKIEAKHHSSLGGSLDEIILKWSDNNTLKSTHNTKCLRVFEKISEL